METLDSRFIDKAGIPVFQGADREHWAPVPRAAHTRVLAHAYWAWVPPFNVFNNVRAIQVKVHDAVCPTVK